MVVFDRGWSREKKGGKDVLSYESSSPGRAHHPINATSRPIIGGGLQLFGD